MLWTMIKNNLKLMLRSKWIFGMMVLGPVFVIASLSSAFHSIMETNSEQKSFKVGYSIAEDSPYGMMIEPLREAGRELEIELVSYGENHEKATALEAKERMQDGSVQVFVSFGEKDYTIYTNEKYEMEAGITKYLLFRMLHTGGMSAEIPMGEQEFITIPDSIDYYGKIELVYFLWVSMIVLSTVVISERKNHIQERFKLSAANSLQLYLAKVIPAFLAISIIMGIATVLSTVIYGIHWGAYVQSAVLLLLGAATVSAFSIVLFYLIPNVAVTIVAGFSAVWIMGFLGGSFECYFYSVIPENIKRISPLYHINRALVEYGTDGASSYGVSAVWFHIAIIVVCSIIGCILVRRKMEEK